MFTSIFELHSSSLRAGISQCPIVLVAWVILSVVVMILAHVDADSGRGNLSLHLSTFLYITCHA